ncbi:hypothetical protein HDV02_005404, partial [Globomyces sp. JEL0801]
MQRRLNPNINANMPILTTILRCNNDLQFLPGNGSPRISRYISYYISNYTSKTSANTTELLKFMNDKLSAIEKYDPEALANDRKLFDVMLVKTLNTFVAGSEMGGPEIASTLLSYPDHYTGESFYPIDWKNWDIWICYKLASSYLLHTYDSILAKEYEPLNDILRNQLAPELDTEIPLEEGFQFRDVKADYLYRNDSLDDLCLYMFIKDYQFTSSSTHENVIMFQSAHPLYFFDPETGYRSGVFKRATSATITLPWFNSTSPIHGIGTENFARLMLILFKPFRTAIDLLGDFFSFADAFSDFKTGKNASELPFKYLYNLEYNAVASREAQNSGVNSFEDQLPGHVEFTPADQEEDRWVVVAPHLPDELDPRDTSRLFVTSDPQSINEIIRSQNTLNLERSTTDIVLPSNEITIQIDPTRSPLLTLDDSADVCFENFVRNLKSTSTSSQWNCVKLVANYFLDLYRERNPAPIRLLLHGEGGTGKSFVIEQIHSMAEILGHPEWLVKCAYTGKAAINIKGDTIDGIFGFSRA